MAVLAMLLGDDCDRSKCIRMTLVHDLSEAIVGDITPYCGISATEKHRLEDEVDFLKVPGTHKSKLDVTLSMMIGEWSTD